jgi:NADPH:quinone reductase-like Zn-dependent oxidoreductase
MVRSIGADHVIDYTRDDFTQSGPRYDLILDMAGNRSLSQLRRALNPRGTLVLVGGEGGNRLIGALSRSIRALVVSPFVSQSLRMIIATANARDLQFLKELIEAGKVMPVIDRTSPLSEVPDAIRYLDQGHARGKIVINVRPEPPARLRADRSGNAASSWCRHPSTVGGRLPCSDARR